MIKYLSIKFENDAYWIEIGESGYATRQVNMELDNQVRVSCLEDCLTEGMIIEDEIEGIVTKIEQHEFENIWNKVIERQRIFWENEKKYYAIGQEVRCKVKYCYPQGWVLKIGELQGICDFEHEIYYNEIVLGKVIGYDEINMWLIIEETLQQSN